MFQNFGRDQGLPHPVPTALAQDQDGFIWIGMQGGLARWDGYRFHTYRANPAIAGSLHDDWVSVLHIDRRGTMWVGGGAGGLARYDRTNDQFHKVALSRSVDRTHIGAVVDDGDGGLWVGTDEGVYNLSAAGDVSLIKADGLPGGSVRSLLREADGTLWVGTSLGLARRAAGASTFQAVPIPNEALGASALCLDGEGRIWIGTRRRGLFLIPERGQQPVPVGSGTGLEKTTVSTIVLTGEGEIWAGVRGGGVWSVNQSDLRVRSIRHDRMVPGSLAHDDIWASLRDNAGSIWIGSSGGLSYHPHDQGIVSTLYGGSQLTKGLSGTDVLSILPLRNGLVWVGYINSGADLIDPIKGRVEELRPQPGNLITALPPTQVIAMAEGPDGTVWFGTRFGLYARNPTTGKLQLIPVPGRLLNSAVNSVTVDGDIVWFGGEEDGLWALRPGPVPETLLSGGALNLADPCINVIRRGAGNDLWVGTRDGLHRIDIETMAVERIAADPADPSALPGRFIISLLFDQQKRLWIGTFGGGIAVMTGRDATGRPRFTRVGLEQGLPHMNVGGMQMDGTGTIWAGTDDGLAMIDSRSLTARSVRRPDGAPLLDYVAGASATGQGGEVLFGALDGMTVARPGTIRPWLFAPPLVITDLRIGGKPVPIGRINNRTDVVPLVLTPRTNSLAVEFAALDYTAPERNRYAYKLEGYDQDWVTADVNRRLAVYTNLSPGQYILRLRGTNREGGPSAGDLALTVLVQPDWYQNRLMQLLAALMLAACFGGLIRWRTAILHQRQILLERQVADRTADLRAANERLERLAMTDTLTSCASRRHFMQQASEMLEQARRDGTQLCMAVLDLDDFKRINDTHGHPAGDAVLAMTGALLSEQTRPVDLVGRVGGEEFAILMPRTDAIVANALAHHLCVALATRQVPTDSGTITVTTSIGVASLGPDDDLDILYARADASLYAAKMAGRNRVTPAPQ